jgi:Phage-related baseplate assembly protein
MADRLPLPDPVLLRELSADILFQARLDEFRERWQSSDILKEIAPDFDTYMLESGPVQVAIGGASDADLHLIAEMNKWSRVLLIAGFASGDDLDLIGAREYLPRFEGEDDFSYWDRILSERRGKMCFGADPWYVRHSKNADHRVLEVAVTGNRRRRVEIAILSRDNNGVPTQDLIDAVQAKLTLPGIPRNNDIVEVVPAAIETVDVTAHATLLENASEAILDPLPAITRAAWVAQSRLGRDLVQDWLKGQMMVPGVYKVEFPGFLDIVVPRNRAVALGDITIELVGRAF